MGRWLWKIAEGLAVAGLFIFIVVPTYMEKEFVRELYANQPVLCITLLTGLVALIVATFLHMVLKEHRNKKNKPKAVSSNSAL